LDNVAIVPNTGSGRLQYIVGSLNLTDLTNAVRKIKTKYIFLYK